MPVMSGVEAVKALREFNQEIPGLAVSRPSSPCIDSRRSKNLLKRSSLSGQSTDLSESFTILPVNINSSTNSFILILMHNAALTGVERSGTSG